MPLSDFTIPGIGAASSIIGGAIARGQAKRDFARSRKLFEEDREYNSPKNQIARLHEAGLPSAAYFSGGASQQSDIFSGSVNQTDNQIGEAGERISKYHSNRLERIQVEAASENLAILKNQRKISDVETNDALSEVEDPNFKMEFTQDPYAEPQQIPNVPRVIASKRQAARIEDAKEKALNISNELLGFKKRIADATTNEEISKIKKELDILIQQELGLKEDVEKKQTENIYLKDELEYKRTITKIRQEFWGKLRVGKVPSIKEMVSLFLLAMENKLN